MATLSQLPSGKWRAQVRRAGVYRAATFPTRREAKDWAVAIEAQAQPVAAEGSAPVPKGATLAQLIDRYTQALAKPPGKTKSATLAVLRRELGKVRLSSLSEVVLRDFIERRGEAGAGGVTIAADLSFLSAVLRWGHQRQLALPERLALQARANLPQRGLNTRSKARERQPGDDELARLYALWRGGTRQTIDMESVCRFALASGMRLGEICRLEAADIDATQRSVLIRGQGVPLPPDAWAIVAPLLLQAEGGLLFPYRAESVSTSFARACRTLGIHDLHFHDLRRRAKLRLR